MLPGIVVCVKMYTLMTSLGVEKADRGRIVLAEATGAVRSALCRFGPFSAWMHPEWTLSEVEEGNFELTSRIYRPFPFVASVAINFESPA
jgi:hypothetical protein